MKKIRPKTASGEHMSRSSRESQLTQKVVLGIMGASMCMMPLAGVTYASDIAKYNAYNTSTTIAENNGVFSIMADYRSGDNAVNQFSRFTLDQYQIANLYFKKPGDTSEAKRLFNFVDGRIDVNGTINAIRGGKVGGDLYFLSKDGMVVGADGVINAGSINIMTPTESAYNSMRFHGKEDKDDHASMEGKISDRADKIISKHFAINPDGTIEIAGTLNAVDGILLRTANIDIKEGAELKTDTIKTSGDVNLIGKNETRAETIDAGGAVTATSGTVVMKTVTTKGLADISGDSISVAAIDAEQAKLTGGTVGVGIVTTKSQADISGKTIIVSTLKAGNAAHVYGGAVDLDTVTAGGDIGILGDNRINIGSIDAKHDAMITQIGIGNAIIDSGSIGNDILISQLSIGNLDVSNLHAKDIARFTVENGDMTLKNISTDKRIGIFNFSRDGITTMDNVHAPNLISYLAFHPHMNDVTSHVVFDILTAGDPARRAIGWKTAAFVKSKVLFGLEIYRYNHRTYDIGGFIDYAPSLYSPENAEAADILIAED